MTEALIKATMILMRLERRHALMGNVISLLEAAHEDEEKEISDLRQAIAGQPELPGITEEAGQPVAEPAKVALSPTAANLALGSLVREVRERLGWSREKFALHLGLDKAAIQLAEQGTLRLDRASLGRITALAPVELTEQLVILSGNPELPGIVEDAPGSPAADSRAGTPRLGPDGKPVTDGTERTEKCGLCHGEKVIYHYGFNCHGETRKGWPIPCPECSTRPIPPGPAEAGTTNPAPDDLCVCGHAAKDHWKAEELKGFCARGHCNCQHFTPENKAGKPAEEACGAGPAR